MGIRCNVLSYRVAGTTTATSMEANGGFLNCESSPYF